LNANVLQKDSVTITLFSFQRHSTPLVSLCLIRPVVFDAGVQVICLTNRRQSTDRIFNKDSLQVPRKHMAVCDKYQRSRRLLMAVLDCVTEMPPPSRGGSGKPRVLLLFLNEDKTAGLPP